MVQEFETLTERNCVLCPGVDQVRHRSYSGDDGHWGDWTKWHTIETPWTIGECVAAAGESLSAQEWQFRRPLHVESKPQADDEFEPLPIEDGTTTQPGRDQARYRQFGGTWSQWWDLLGTPATMQEFIAERPSYCEWEFRRRKQPPVTPQPQPTGPEQPPVSAGSKYRRMIRQTLPEGHAGASVICDVYDVLQAWDVACPAIQHAIKKLLQPGQRGSKSAVQDLREAIGSIERAIQLMGDG